jgi:4-diphosphocytidyl-2-C-methyl-D-erythritol kinase
LKEINKSALAKINIGLEVLRKRDDGFHEINSIMSLIDLADELEFKESIRTEVVCPEFPELNMQNNIVFNTITELKKKFYLVEKNVKVLINKKIPIGAGLGGGSSDAATTLKVLNSVWFIGMTRVQMYNIANKIGSDVVFFLKNQSAIVKGKGDIIRHFQYKIPYQILVVYPKINISTKEAYENLNIENKIKLPTDFFSIIKQSLKMPYILREYIKNDFEEVIFQKYPIIKEIKETLYGFGALFALMSGSGSSVYGFFEKLNEAELAMAQFPEFDCFLCKGS